MAVLTRDALEGSPLADLHIIAGEIGLEGFRKLRKADLVDKLLEHGGGEQIETDALDVPDAEPAVAADADVAEEDGVTDEDAGEDRPKRRRGGRGGRGRRNGARDADPGDDAEEDDADEADEAPEPREPRGRGRGRGRGGSASESDRDEGVKGPSAEAKVAEGTVELLGNGSGFLRVSPPEASDDDVYISAAQVRRCELVSGDTITGPVRPPRRSERYPSLVRIDTINGRPADEVAEGTPFDELAAVIPTERFALGSEDPTLKAIEWLTPIGRGSRVTITGAARAGKSEALRRLAGALHGIDELEVTVVLAGVRPEELSLVPEGIEPAAALPFTASPDAQAQAVDRAVDAARRIAARGGHAVVLVDTLDGLPASAARKALAAARQLKDGGSLTVIGTATAPYGGETTVIALDVALASTGRLPALNLVESGTLRPELLVGDAGADAIAQARAQALGI